MYADFHRQASTCHHVDMVSDKDDDAVRRRERVGAPIAGTLCLPMCQPRSGTTYHRDHRRPIPRCMGIQSGLTTCFVRQTLLLRTSCICAKSIPCKDARAGVIFTRLDKVFHPQLVRVFKICFASLSAQYCLRKSDPLSR
jgi:hypothetical protein